jgi:hypothetical protein
VQIGVHNVIAIKFLSSSQLVLIIYILKKPM